MALTFDTHPGINQIEVERDCEEVINLFLKEYFDGAEHSIGSDAETQDLTFDECLFLFGVAQLPKNSGMPILHTIIRDDLKVRSDRTGDSTREQERTLQITHLVRVAHGGDNEKGARFQCRRVADRMRLLYEHEAQLRLSRKGLFRARLLRGPVELPMVGYSVRQLVCEATLRYSQTVSTIG